MIKRNTVLIVGAGASMPYGLPSGQGLRDAVLRSSGKTWMYDSLEQIQLHPEKFEKFIQNLRTSGYSSIDAFLEERLEWIDYGKAAMARCLMDSEKSASLFPPHHPKDHWMEILWQKMKAPSWPEFKKNAVKIVSFNYDRLIERYLMDVTTNHYGISVEEFGDIKLINHVHGHLGKSCYGEINGEDFIKSSLKNIRIVHEGSTSRKFQEAKRDLKKADCLLFIGFGYGQKNLDKLGINPQTRKPKSLYHQQFVTGTSKGIMADQWRAMCEVYGFANPQFCRKYSSVSHLLKEHFPHHFWE